MSAISKVSSCFVPKFGYIQVRFVSYFNSKTANDLWNSTSPQGKRTGRGKRAQSKTRVDLGRGKMLGVGPMGMQWPGLNTSPFKQTSRMSQEGVDALEEKKNIHLSRRQTKRESTRGWTGGRWGGVWLGPPEPVEGQLYEGFNSVIMDVARVSHMNKMIGRVYGARAMVAVGNGNGLVAVSSAVCPIIVSAVRSARAKAIKRLQFIERYEERTVFEDIYVNHHRTYMSIRPQLPGYGLRCHRALRDMCKLIGIKDVYIKTSGSTTMLNVLKCFMKGMRMQESYQDKADRLGYHVVRFDPLKHNYPEVLASPSNNETKTVEHDDYNEYINQELLIKAMKKRDREQWSPFYNTISTDNRGVPTLVNLDMPESMLNIKNLSLD